jgi:sugar transferase (PEP-CTERM system associated)
MCLVVAFTAAWRFGYGTLFQKNGAREGAVIIGAGERGSAIYRLLNSPMAPYEVRGFLDNDPAKQGRVIGTAMVLGTADQLLEVARRSWVKVAILAIPRDSSPTLVRAILEARLLGIKVLDMADVYEQLTGRVPVKHIEDQWLLYADGFYLLSKEYLQKVKRLIDLAVAGLILLCLSPLMAVTALLIKLESRGPVFYRQERVGKAGRIFTVVKFRSMCENAEADGARWAVRNDCRVTRVGKWIRLLRIDEVPQIWNVFRGDMSMVGPRPERPEFVDNLEQLIPYYSVRHAVRPGLTGWAQVNYPYGASVEDARHKLEYDLYYIKNMSLSLDFTVLLKTIGVVLMGDGAR